MAVEAKNLIAALNPDIYCKKDIKDEVKKIAKEKGLLAAAEKAELKDPEYIDVILAQKTIGAFKLAGLKNPIEQHTLEYDDFSQNLEPVYFWILDYISREYVGADKLIDNFISSPGSGQFAEMSKRATVLQEEGMKIFGTTNTVIRSILNIIYDLKEFKLRLAEYDALKSKDEKVRFAARLALKQIWLDSVDIKRQTSSIKGFAQQFDYVTLIDAFMAANSLEDVDKLDLNERVKRIIQQRIPEFLRWVEESDRELRKRFEIEKIYLKSQVNSLKLYSRWLKPYLKAARQLEQNAGESADIVNFFNTSVFELSLLGKGKWKIEEDIQKGDLPLFFRKQKFRKYIPLTIIDFKYRAAPDRTDQRGGYSYRGKVNITFTSFALNEDEIKVLKREIDNDNLGEVYKVILGATDESMGQIQTDIDQLLGDKEEEEKEVVEDTNPFSSLFSFFKDEKKEKKDFLKEGIPPKDSEYEKVIRSQVSLKARLDCRKIYDAYKKSIGMSVFPPTAF